MSSPAGILFKEDIANFLAGFQQKLGRWGGFGGKPLEDETLQETAVRETVEELFEVYLKKEDLLALTKELDLWLAYADTHYTFYVVPLSTIFTLIRFCQSHGYTSPVYPVYPTTIAGLIDDRVEVKAKEVQKIQLFSFYEITARTDEFDKYFLHDLVRFLL
jgi:hypothetical protein